ncbi:MAG: hypothetical protein FJ246_05765 [Nitrospira sp.]|nr:hypothetical protein [Nitrospira sp.]
MPLGVEDGKRMLQLVTSRYDQREWRKKIEKTLSLSATGVGDDVQRAIFLYLKHGLKAYKSRRADLDSWIVGGYATKEVIDRAKFNPTEVGAAVTKEDVALLGVDPGQEVDAAWWDEMLVAWFEEPGAEATEVAAAEESPSTAEAKAKPAEA